MEHGPEDIQAQNPLFDEVVKMYREYKRQYVKNIGFNETAFSTIFGEFQFLSDPGVPGVRSMGPDLSKSVRDYVET